MVDMLEDGGWKAVPDDARFPEVVFDRELRPHFTIDMVMVDSRGELESWRARTLAVCAAVDGLTGMLLRECGQA